jgi:hypothetical protein
VITDTILDLLLTVWEALLGWLPALPSFDWMNAPVVISVASDVAAMGSWLPLDAIATVVTVLVASWLAAGGIVIGRMFLSLFTGGGGNVGSVA